MARETKVKNVVLTGQLFGVCLQDKIPLITSRECPYGCTYCNVHMIMGKGFRKRSPENVLEEIEYWYGKGIRSFAIGDDDFTFDIQRVIDICDLIIDRKLDIYWELRTGIRIDRVNEPLMKKTLGKSLEALLGFFCKITSIRKAALLIGFRFTSLARKLQVLQLRCGNS